MDPSKDVAQHAPQVQVDVVTDEGGNGTPWYKQKLSGWRFGILMGKIAACVTLIINIAIFAAVSARKETVRYAGTGKALYEGNCDKVRRVNIGLHLIINLLSSLLLSASNHGMQYLSAPTREEVDRAHAKRSWLNIGVMSVSNIGSISGKRVLLWLTLAVSSLPLHLFYNATVYSSIYAREYVIFSANQDMVDLNSNSSWLGGKDLTDFFDATAQILREKAMKNQLTRLENQECINAYATPLLTRRGNLILVTNDTDIALPGSTAERTLETVFVPGSSRDCQPHPFQWICGGSSVSSGCEFTFGESCASKWQSIDAANWQPLGFKVSHCLSEDIEQLCRLQFNRELAAVVIAFNCLKALVLAYILLGGVKETPLLTMGDAVASFLKRPDATTSGLCLMSKESITLWKKRHIVSEQAGRVYDSTRPRWATAVSKGRWASSLVLYAGIIFLCLGLFLYGIIGRTTPADQLLALPLGAADPTAFIYSWGAASVAATGSLIFNVFMANLPQLALSGIYFTYNGLFTCFLLGYEWSTYSTQRKGLRVSHRREGHQRATYFLQLPLRFAIPLIVLSITLHWLTSQSIFLVSIFLDSSSIFVGSPSTEVLGDLLLAPLELNLCGYSPRAILAVVIMGVVMVCIAVGAGLQRYRSGMPVAGSCSAAISALCHLPRSEDGDEAARMPVQWGVTGPDANSNGFFMHCAFSSGEVQEPQRGVLYAGLKEMNALHLRQRK